MSADELDVGDEQAGTRLDGERSQLAKLGPQRDRAHAGQSRPAAHRLLPRRLADLQRGAKLLLHPALVWALGRAAQAAGLPLTGGQLTALTLAAALPSASNVSMLAERYGADNGRVARIIMSSTLLAFGSFSLAAWWMGAG